MRLRRGQNPMKIAFQQIHTNTTTQKCIKDHEIPKQNPYFSLSMQKRNKLLDAEGCFKWREDVLKDQMHGKTSIVVTIHVKYIEGITLHRENRPMNSA